MFRSSALVLAAVAAGVISLSSSVASARETRAAVTADKAATGTTEFSAHRRRVVVRYYGAPRVWVRPRYAAYRPYRYYRPYYRAYYRPYRPVVIGYPAYYSYPFYVGYGYGGYGGYGYGCGGCGFGYGGYGYGFGGYGSGWGRPALSVGVWW